ncbi:MAG: DegT/DnrJ/EryC1/StrS family aminotransferase [Verrucomicrobia bacterium]|nr:DegT/DnrJ/EryC1/StrS family aminotransferase [Verrucomicrobiota bacterium]
MSPPVSRRKFLGSAAGASLALGLGRGSAAETSASTPAAAPITKPVSEWPLWDNRDETALLDVLHSGKWGRTAGGAARVKEFEAAYAARMKAKFCVATSSGTTALLTSLGALNIGPGDEVIMPPYTFVATFNSITASFALPVFADTDAATFQIDPKKMAAAITPATKLLLPVHIAGSPADLDAITALAKARNITLLEDACQAPLAEWRNQPVGTFGIGGCFSFQASKNLTSGEGGAVLTNDENFANLCYNFHTPGGPKPAPSLGRAANFRLTEFQAALLLAQMTRLEAQAKTRDANAAYLSELLRQIPGSAPAALAPGCTRSGWHLYMFRYEAAKFAGLTRAKFLQLLAKEGIAASSGYTSLNTSAHVKALASNPHYQRIYGKKTMDTWVDRNQCPVNDRLVEEAVWLSQTKLLNPRSEMERIASVIAGIQKRAGELARS